jgi:hypothetical protein
MTGYPPLRLAAPELRDRRVSGDRNRHGFASHKAAPSISGADRTTASAEGPPRMASDAGTLGNLHRAIFRQFSGADKLPPGRGRDNVRASSFGVALIAVSVAGIILGLVAVARIW